MNKELEEAKKYLMLIKNKLDFNKQGFVYGAESIDTILHYINNSIPKKTIQKYLKEEQEKYDVYKKESKTNDNLKMGLYKHIGAKNMCEKILGIEKIVTLD